MAVSFTRTDLEHILQQILMAESGQPPVSPHLAFGLRQVQGTYNNLVPGQEDFGASGEPFANETTQYFRQVTVNVDGTMFDPNPLVDGDTITTNYAGTGPVDGMVVDTAPRTISNLISDLSSDNPAAVAAAQEFGAQLGDGYTVFSSNPDGLWLAGGTPSDEDNLFIGNITPDAGLSAPFNSWMTFFGQFFDHGLDLISKGGNSTVFVPLLPDDPLYSDAPGAPNFMALTRATLTDINGGADGILGDNLATLDVNEGADDVHLFRNETTPFVDQNQTYASHPSHQVFLREYITGADGKIHTTGNLLQRAEGKDGIAGNADDNSGMATWADLKANAEKLGIILTDYNIGNVPQVVTDAYGNFLAGPLFGGAQVVTASGTVEMDPNAPALLPADTLFIDRAFLNDLAHTASPFNAQTGLALTADTDTDAGNLVGAGEYDDELLAAHYVAGDGRVNENVALITVHSIFHDEHNRLVEQVKQMVQAQLDAGDTAFATDWVLPGVVLTPGVAIAGNQWNGERVFQAAKFGTETQYQHLVFEEFARKVAPTIHLFGNVDIHLDPAITSEFANAVYRFGHSMLDENVPIFQLNPDGTMAIGPDGQPLLTDMGLIEAFVNPLAFADLGTTGAAQIVQGATHQIGSEIDEFVTGALRNNLLGLPLDLAALNIARGRDTGVAPLNLVRAQIYAATNDQTLKPYSSWAEFGQFLKHSESLINFVAAYGTHASITAADTLVDMRAAALDLVNLGLDQASATAAEGTQARDAWDFMHSLGDWANDENNPVAVHAEWSTGSITGLDTVDLWIGGLAEKQNLFGGLLGSTFNFIFETQMESLQDADRLYYLPRIEGMDFGFQIENNSFADMIITNTGAKHIPASVFLTPEYTVEAGDYFEKDVDGHFILDLAGNRIPVDSALWLRNPVTGALLVEVLPDGTVHFIGDDNFFGNTIVLGGTEGDDRLQAGHADDDTVWGDGGNDWIDGGNGNDNLFGGAGNDTIVDSGGDDIIHGEDGDDSIYGGIGDDIIFAGAGNDYVETGFAILGDEAQGGAGNDILIGGDSDDALFGNEGDDWLEGGAGGDGLVGDTGAPTGQVPLFAANDVLDGGANGDKMVGFSGDDIMLGEGGFDRFMGLLGFDWASFEKEQYGVSADMERREFIPNQEQPAGDAVRDFFIETEAVSGSAFDDFLQGTENFGGAAAVFNTLSNVDLIFNLAGFFAEGPVNYGEGNIMLGGDGSDVITGRGGDDIIDGDAWLHVGLTSREAGGEIVREIRFDLTEGDIDVAVYRGSIDDYVVNFEPDAQGFVTVAHNVPAGGGGGAALGIPSDGIDRLRNIERIQFADAIVNIDQSPDANLPPEGLLLITDDDANPLTLVNAVVNTALVADASLVTDPDNAGGVITNPAFQWQQQLVAAGGQTAWVNIAGATNSTYTPSILQVDLALRVVMTYTDDRGLVERIASAATAPTVPDPALNTAPFVIGQQSPLGLPDTSAHTGFPVDIFLPLVTTFGDHETPSNELLFSARIAGSTQILDGSPAAQGLTFTLVPDLVNGGVSGARITGTPPSAGPVSITVTATDLGDPNIAGPDAGSLSVTDTFIINVQNGNLPPVISAAPESFNGTEDTPLSGALLGPASPDADGPGGPVWRLVQGSAVNGAVVVDGATGNFTFTPFAELSSDDLSDPVPEFSFRYRLFDGLSFSAEKTVTLEFDAVDDGPAEVLLTGTAASGGSLSAVIGVDPDGPWISGTETYQWYRDGVLLDGATDVTLALTSADIGHTFSVEATYTDGQNFTAPASSQEIEIGSVDFTGTPGIATPSISVLNTIVDPDGSILPEGVEWTWEVSTNGVNWNPAPAAGISADTQIFTPAVTGAAGAFVRVSGFYIDDLGELNFISSDPRHYIVDATTTNNNLQGTSASELIFGNGGNDTIRAGAGADFVRGGGGNDTFFAQANDGDDEYEGGAGNDTFNLSAVAGASIVDLLAGTAGNASSGNDILRSVENVTGGAGDDVFTGNASANQLRGNGGADILDGGSAGADLLAGGTGNDTYIVSHGGMTLDESNNQGTDTVLSSISFNLGNNFENLTLTGTANINGSGNGSANVIRGNSGNNSLGGGGGNDTFIAAVGDGNDAYVGNAGTDTLDLSATSANAIVNLATGVASSAQIGSDTIASIERVIGGSGDDTFTAGNPPETFTGGLGEDAFVFLTRQAAGEGAGGRAVITDFQHLVDFIDVSAIDAVTGGGDTAFIFDAAAKGGSGQVAAGHLGYYYATIGGVAHTIIEGNIQGVAGSVDFQIDLIGTITLTEPDFGI